MPETLCAIYNSSLCFKLIIQKLLTGNEHGFIIAVLQKSYHLENDSIYRSHKDEKAKEDNHAYCKIAYHVEKRKHHKEGHNCKYAYRESGQDTPAFAYSIEENKKMLFNTRTENNNTDH